MLCKCLAMVASQGLAHALKMLGKGKLWQMLGNGTSSSGASPRLAPGRRICIFLIPYIMKGELRAP